MIDINILRHQPEIIRKSLQDRGVNFDLDSLIKLDEERREYIKKIENLRHQQKQEKDQTVAKTIKEEIKKAEVKQKELEEQFQNLIVKIPNSPLEEVPIGKDESQNVVVREVGKKRDFKFQPKDYLTIAEKLDLIDVKRAAKVVGTRYSYLKGDGAMLEFGLINLALKTLIKEGFIPVIPPVMLKPEMMKAMGYVERGGDEIYWLEKDNLYLTGTAEQSLGAMHADEIFEEKDLPKRYVGFSTCFRREAGSYGKDTKGIIRVHQFDKLEMFSFCHPEKSKEEHKYLLSLQEKLMQALELPYHVLQMCTGDLGDPAANKIDLEAWMPGQNQYRETHSCSNCTDFQARRLNIKYRDSKTNKLEFVHTLNGTAFSQRPIIAIIENYQKEDGSFDWPKVLK